MGQLIKTLFKITFISFLFIIFCSLVEIFHEMGELLYVADLQQESKRIC
ncbi:MAG: hypothetical protein HOG03_23470 [Desulfobacula sp.]|jgi:hypothetical protein|nr:hypothetical protein [Desulfobacula sp.]MBT6338417.1 hypothetical protein [Desulfobacula sp.]MBT6751746.1 hypothetical protein [Desulfobacula sp.]